MYKFCKICGEMKQFSHKLHMIIQKRIEVELNKPLDELLSMGEKKYGNDV